MSQREKQKLGYKLFGSEVGERRYIGLVEQGGGRRLGRGCFLVPKEKAEGVLNILAECGVKYEILEAYMPSKPPKLAGFTWLFPSGER